MSHNDFEMEDDHEFRVKVAEAIFDLLDKKARDREESAAWDPQVNASEQFSEERTIALNVYNELFNKYFYDNFVKPCSTNNDPFLKDDLAEKFNRARHILTNLEQMVVQMRSLYFPEEWTAEDSKDFAELDINELFAACSKKDIVIPSGPQNEWWELHYDILATTTTANTPEKRSRMTPSIDDDTPGFKTFDALEFFRQMLVLIAITNVMSNDPEALASTLLQHLIYSKIEGVKDYEMEKIRADIFVNSNIIFEKIKESGLDFNDMLALGGDGNPKFPDVIEKMAQEYASKVYSTSRMKL